MKGVSVEYPMYFGAKPDIFKKAKRFLNTHVQDFINIFTLIPDFKRFMIISSALAYLACNIYVG